MLSFDRLPCFPAATRPAGSFRLKLIGAACLALLADRLFYGSLPGATLGLFALAWTAMLVATRPAVRHRRSGLPLLLAAGYAVVLIDDPSMIGVLLFGAAVGSATLLVRWRFGDAFGWTGRLLVLGVAGLARPLGDLLRVLRLPARSSHRGIRGVVGVLIVPIVGGASFVALFASANPLIGAALKRITLPDLSSLALHALLWLAVAIAVWPTLRPPTFDVATLRGGPRRRSADLSAATVIVSLATFNAVFALQNALDLVFLWSGAALPGSVTLADYAHRGAYTLIATALLAGLFVLVGLRPGSAAAASRSARRLVTVWVAQNLLLVASSALRLADYVAAFGMTRLRIAAFAWMALVALGLVLIAWRLLAVRSARWLVNANACAAAVMLSAASVVDLGAVAATWNVDHARKAGDLDLCYLRALGSSALLPLIVLEHRASGPVLRDQAAYLREQALADLARNQRDWQRWTARGARRLAAARAALGRSPVRPLPAPDGRDCDGSRFQPTPLAALPPRKSGGLTKGVVR